MMMEDYYYNIPVTFVFGMLLMFIIPKIYRLWSSKADGLSEEEANYVRYLHLLLDLGAKALRQYFDSMVPPHKLKAHLAKYEKDCRKKKQWGFTLLQLDAMFPAKSINLVSSSAFDASLMYKLIRNTFSVPSPAQGWGKDPLPGDTTLTDDVERIRIHRNYLAHINDPTICNKEFQERWDDLSQAIKRLSYNSQWQNICKLRIKAFSSNSREEAVRLHADHIAVLENEVDGLKTGISSVKIVMTSLSQDLSVLKTDLKELDSSHIPKNVRDQHIKYVMKWFKEDAVYYETIYFHSAIMCARSKNILTLVGGPGTGKTATMRHIALLLEKEDYIITPISDIQEIIQYGQVDKKHLFLIDDVLGTFGLQIIKLNKVKDYEEQILNLLGKTSKLLMTCRKSVYNEALRYKSFVTKVENVIDLEGEENKLTENEKKEICKSHCTYAGVKQEVYKNLKFDFPMGMFPLLCKVFANDVQYHKIGARFFKYPYKYILEEIDRLQVHNPLHYAALVLCALNHNKLSQEVLDRSKLNDLKADIFKRCEVKSSTESWEIVKALSMEDGTYTTKLENDFTLIHDFICEVIACHYGKQNLDHILKYISSSFICKNVSVSKSENSDEGPKINIQEKHYQLLAERLYKDIRDMNLDDVFMNQCLQNKDFCECFIQILESKPCLEIISLFLLSRSVSSEESVCMNISSNEKLYLLVDKRYRKGKGHFLRHLTYNIRVVSWVVFYGYTNILQYIINKVTSRYKSADLLFGFNIEEQARLLILGCWSGNEDLVKIIIKHAIPETLDCAPGYNDDYFDHFFTRHRHYTPLTAACGGGLFHIVITLIESECDVNKTDNKGYTPLTSACRNGHLSIVTKLIECGCDLTSVDDYSCTPIKAACDGGHFNIVTNLLDSGYDINKSSNDVNVTLTEACLHGHLNIVIKLIESGCDIYKAEKDMYTPLAAACKGGHLNIVNKLLECGCDINKSAVYGYTPLTAACRTNFLYIVTKLMECGCDINQTDNIGYTPLTSACGGGNVDIVIKLVESGCDINRADNTYWINSPLTTACDHGHLNIVNKLLDSGCDINKVVNNVYTPIIKACQAGHLEIVTKLLDAGYAIKNVGNCGYTPLIAACQSGHLKIVTKLIEYGCDINKAGNTSWKQTPLTAACKRGHLNIVNKLIESGCDINKTDNEHYTPLTTACKYGYFKIFTKLIESGCDINKADGKRYTPFTVACQHGCLEIVIKLLDSGFDVKKHDNDGCTSLLAACQSGHIDIVIKLIESGWDINRAGNTIWKYTPLTAACRHGHYKIVCKLIESGSDINKSDNRGYIPLTVACQHGNFKIVNKLLESGFDVEKKCGSTSLIAACQSGHLNIVGKLIEFGFDINKAGDTIWKHTPLTAACEFGNLDIVSKLINSRCDINKADDGRYTPLTAACKHGHLKIVTKLIETGCDINKADNKGYTPITVASQHGHLHIVTKLLECGCDLKISVPDGYTPLTAACQRGDLNIASKLIEYGYDINKAGNRVWKQTPLTAACHIGNLDIVRKLIESGCDINKADNTFWFNTPLTAACKQGHLNVVSMLIEAKCDINKAVNGGCTPLTAACKGGHHRVVNKLIESGSNLNKSDYKGYTPLTAACQVGNLDIVCKLAESGCDINKASNDGYTPLTVACQYGYLKIVTKLIESGCDRSKSDNDEHTPLIAACHGGHVNIVNKLMESGYDMNKAERNLWKKTAIAAAYRGGHLNLP